MHPSNKLVLVGDYGSGKTSLFYRIWKDDWLSQPQPFLDFFYHSLVLDGNNIRLQIWDFVGAERYNRLSKHYLRNSKIILMCYSIQDRKSFDHVEVWHKQIKQLVDWNAVIGLVGNKCDAEQRKVQYLQGRNLAEKLNCQFGEVSAKTGAGVTELLLRLVKQAQGLKYLELGLPIIQQRSSCY